MLVYVYIYIYLGVGSAIRETPRFMGRVLGQKACLGGDGVGLREMESMYYWARPNINFGLLWIQNLIFARPKIVLFFSLD